jgi:hypothetical protein
MDVPHQLQIFRKRDFGDIIGDSFKILFKNIKPLTLGFLIYVMPIFLLAAGIVALLGGDSMKKLISQDVGSMDDIGSMLTGFGFLYLGLIFCYMMLWTLVYSAMKAYKDKGSQVITFEELQTYFKQNVWKVSMSMIMFFLCLILPLSLVVGVLAMISPMLLGFSMIFIMPAMLYFTINFTFFPYAVVEENLDFVDGIKRSFYLIKENWWATFAIMLVAGIVSSLMSYVFAIPYYIYVFVYALSSTSVENGIESMGYMMAISYMISLLGALYASMYTSTATVLKYYDLVEQKDAVQLSERINALGTKEESFFENEGDF